MKASVVFAVYNRAGYVTECIESILAQTLQDFEIIVADDCSEDNTLEVLRSIAAKDSRVKVLSNPRHRFIETLNMAMSMAQGEYIARIDSDDTMLPQRLQRQVECMDADPTVAVCCSWYDTFGDYHVQGDHISGRITRPYYRLLLGNFLANPTSMIRRSFLTEQNICYQEENIYSEDYKLWTEIAKLGGSFYVIPEVLTRYRIHEGQLSRQFAQIQEESAFKAQMDALNDIVEALNREDSRVGPLFEQLAAFNENGLLSTDTIVRICYELAENNARHAVCNI